MTASQSTLILSLSLCTAITPAKLHAQDDNELRQRAAKVNNEQLNRVYENNLPNKSGSTVASGDYYMEEIRKAREKSEKDEWDAKVRAIENARIAADYAEYTDQHKKDHALRVRKIEAQQSAFLSALSSQHAHLNVLDRLNWYYDHLFAEIEGPEVGLADRQLKDKMPDYIAASHAVKEFDNVRTKATYEALADLIWKSRILYYSTQPETAYLYTAFPEKQAETEQLELRLIPYYLGANRPYVERVEDVPGSAAVMYYPASYLESSSRDNNKKVLLRFIELANKYPQQASSPGSVWRKPLNPYMLYTLYMSGDYEPGLDTAKDTYYVRAIHSPIAADDLKTAFEWLTTREKGKAHLKALTETDWREMAKQQQRSMLTISRTQVLIPRKGWIPMQEQYKNLKKAVKTWDKEIDREVKEDRKKRKKQGLDY